MTTTTSGSATDLITFSRGSLATVTDSNGYIKWAPHNLLLASEQFDASNWTKSSATVTANSIAAPDGTTTADTIAASGANGTTLQSYSAIAVSYVFGVWLRRKTGTGNIQIAADNGTYTTVTITNDWALYTVTQTPTAGTKSAGIRIVTSGDEVYAWGAHLYRSDLGGMQANASAYPYYNPSTPKNLLGYSEAFDNAAWLKSALLAFGSGSVVNAIAAPNGSLTADLIVENTANNWHAVYQGITIASGGTYTLSVYLKSAGRQYANLSLGGTGGDATNWISITADLTNGTITSNQAGALGTYVSSNISSAGNGWYRVSMTGNIGAVTSANFSVATSDVGNPTRSNYAIYNYTGDGVSGIYLWGAQLSDSASLDPYVGSYGAAPSPAAAYGPRLDYDPSTLAAKGLLVEEQRTNLFQRSSEFNTTWVPGGLSSISVNSAVAPDGTSTADKLVEDTGNSEHYVYYPDTLSSATYTLSVYMKAAGRNWGNIRLGQGTFGTAYFNLSDGTVGTVTAGYSASIMNVGNGWYRCSISGTAASTIYSGVFYPATADGTNSYTGDGTSGIFVWGAQLEAGSFATSYIPTAAATVTRNADVASVATSQFPYSATEGTLVVNGTFLSLTDTNPSTMVSLSNATFSNSINIYRQTAQMQINIITGGVVNASYSVSASTEPIKAAIAYKLNDVNAAVNGTAQTTDTSATMPASATTLDIGSMWATGVLGNGHIRQITYIPRRLTNAELISRTA